MFQGVHTVGRVIPYNVSLNCTTITRPVISHMKQINVDGSMVRDVDVPTCRNDDIYTDTSKYGRLT